MKRPLNPRHHGLKEPEKIISQIGKIYVSDLANKDKVSLSTLINVWNKTVKYLESNGHRITSGPVFEPGLYYGQSISLTYTYERDNNDYEVQRAAYENTVKDYLVSLAAFKAYEVNHKAKLKSGDIDYQIERAEHRLVNLLAKKNGQPLPYPEG